MAQLHGGITRMPEGRVLRFVAAAPYAALKGRHEMAQLQRHDNPVAAASYAALEIGATSLRQEASAGR